MPDSSLLVLDLFCDVTPVWNRTRGFCGKPWVWCALQNFGDCVYLGGALTRLHQDLPSARNDPLGQKLSGIGFVNEGLDYNPIVFDFLFEQSWRAESVDLDRWVQMFARRVYGGANEDSEAAWRLLRETVYTGQHQVSPAYTQVPSVNAGGEPPYSNELLARAWKHLLDASRSEPVSDAFQYELLMVTRQVLGNYSAEVAFQAADAWRAKDRARFEANSRRMLRLIRDLDELLGTRPEFLLGGWLADARRWGDTPEERKRLEWNARRVITMWGEQTQIRDYSRRDWSGMLNGFYLKRWEKFYDALRDSLVSGTAFDQAAFDGDLQLWERKWASEDKRYRTRPAGDTVQLCHRLWETYGRDLQKQFEPDAPSLTTGKPATASSSLPGHPASLANDGRRRSTERYWATDISNDPAPWWQVDLGEATPVGRVVTVAYFGDERSYGFVVEGSNDGQHWELLAENYDKALSSSEGYTHRFPQRELRHLRIRETHNSANTGRHLVEVLAFEE